MCSVGTLASGASAKITIVVKANAAGTIVNTAVVVGDEPEAGTANNAASATYIATNPFKLPVAKIKLPAIACYGVNASPHSLTVGRHTRLSIVVRTNGPSGKPAQNVKVTISGAGIQIVTAGSNRLGVIRVTITPKKPGIVLIKPAAKRGCGNQRIGAVGAFTPPVTG